MLVGTLEAEIIRWPNLQPTLWAWRDFLQLVAELAGEVGDVDKADLVASP
jgi:hypothetical protein